MAATKTAPPCWEGCPRGNSRRRVGAVTTTLRLADAHDGRLSTFRAALQEHLAAIQARDAERFAATLSDDAMVVDGKGAIVRGTPDVLASHAAWFAMQERWSFDYDLVAIRETPCLGLALVHVTYRHTPEEQESRFLLSLVFERGDDGVFRFAYDQNTPLP